MSRKFVMFWILWGLALILLAPWGNPDLLPWLKTIVGMIFAAMAGVLNWIDLEELYEGKRDYKGRK